MSKGGKIVIAVGLGFMAALFGLLYLTTEREKIVGGSQIVRVYVAAVDIKPNTPIDGSMVAVRSVPKNFLQPGSITISDVPDKSKISGVTLVPIRLGEQMLRTKLYEGAPPPLSAQLQGKTNLVGVGIAMEAFPNSMHGLVKAGDHVDVLASFKFEKSKDEDFTEIRPLFQNVEVLAVNDKTIGSQRPSADKGPDSQTEKITKDVTLALTPVQAQQVVLAQQLGNIWLLLRATGDNAPHQYEIWNNERLLQSQYRLWKSESPQTQMMRELAGRR